MASRCEEVYYSPMNENEFGEADKKSPQTVRQGFFEYWGPYSYYVYVDSPIGTFPISFTTTVGIVRDKTTGRTCMCHVNQIKFQV